MQYFDFFLEKDKVFTSRHEILNFIADFMYAQGSVKASFKQALLERETNYPTGIQLAKHAIAIPHCDAEHVIKPAIFLIKLKKAVYFEQADDDSEIPVNLIISLIIKDPKAQLQLLKKLFSSMRDPHFISQLLESKDDAIGNTTDNTIDLFKSQLLR